MAPNQIGLHCPFFPSPERNEARVSSGTQASTDSTLLVLAANRNPFEIRRRLSPQIAQQTLAIPIHKVHHTELIGLGIRPRLIRSGVDPALVLFGQATVLVVGGVPDLAHALHVVVDAFDRVLVHDPLGGDHGFLGADWPHGEHDDVVAHAVVPGVRQVQDAHRTEVRVLDAAHEFGAALFAVQGHRHGALEQWHAHDAVTQAETGVGVRDLLGFPGSGGGGDVVLERLVGARVGDVVPCLLYTSPSPRDS